jgi:hydrogenase-4 component B
MSSLPGLETHPAMTHGAMGMASGLASFDVVVPVVMTAALAGALALAMAVTMGRGAVRRVPTWGCGGELTARTEYTATAFSKPLMMIFRAVYRPTREVEALAKVSPYFPHEVRYRAEIEPTFERYLYAPLLRAVMGTAQGMKVLQAGSLHAYLAYVIALVLTLVLFVWWRR